MAEYNHALNAEQACRQWRWIYQTYTHWNSIVYLLIEISQRPWSSIAERAWVALHSSWLIPARSSVDKNLRIWVPLRKLMAKARKHRDAELKRLRADPEAAVRLEMEDRNFPVPSSSGPFPTVSSVDIFRERWRQLVAMPERPGDGTQISQKPCSAGLADSFTHATYANQPTTKSTCAPSPSGSSSNLVYEQTYLGTNRQQPKPNLGSVDLGDLEPMITTNAPNDLVAMGQTLGPSYDDIPMVSADWSNFCTMGPGFDPWLWADADPSSNALPTVEMDPIDVGMDLDSEMNWYNWVESAKGMELDPGFSASGWT